MYYPLRVGNRWDYRFSQHNLIPNPPDTSYSYSVSVIGDRTFPNGKTYFELSQGDLSGYGSYVRVDSDCVYYYNQNDSTEFLVFKFRAHLNDYWQIGPTPSFGARLSDTATGQIFGRQTNTLTFTLGNLVFSRVTFSNLLGPITYSSDGEPPGTSSTYIMMSGCLISDSLFGQLTSVEQSIAGPPSQIDLYQNYPNPFNSVTAIHFAVTEPASVQLLIFNQLGQLVHRLDQAIVAPGDYTYFWYASSLSSGIYFVRLRAGSSVATRKMVLLK